MSSESFPKSERLRRRSEYLEVQGRGRKVQSEHFFLLLLPVTRSAATVRTRIGVTVSSKVGNAVVRNRIKRWVREWVRRHKSALPPGEGVVVAKASAASVAHPTCDGDLARLFGKARS